MFKLQLAIEKFFLSAMVIVVAIVVSYFLFKSFYSVVSHTSIKSYLTQASFDDIYGNKTNIFILLKNETNIGSNVIISETITFNNGTSKTYKIPFTLQMASTSQGGFLYDFATMNFPAISNNSQPIKISNVFIFSGNYIIESENNSVIYSSYYYTKSSLENVPLYYLNMSVSPLGAGVLTPGNGYYYAGSKVAISEKPNIGYVFSSWSGFGNGNYTGPNQTTIIEMNSNITEYAKYVKLVKIFVNATYNGIPVYVNSALNTTTNGTIYLMPNIKYTISFPEYVTFSNGTRYAFKSLQDNCGISISPNSNSTTFVSSYAIYNCKFMANYDKQYSLSINANSSEGSVTPFGGWYNVGSRVKMSVASNYGYIFTKVIGNGNGSYTGTNNPFYVTMNSPITENVIFVPIVYVYVKSSVQATPYSFESNYGIFYNGTTNSSFMAPAGATLTLNGIDQVNWGERKIINIANSTCASSGNSITLPTNGGSSCTVYLTPPTTQYLFIMNEFLNGRNESNNFTYGSVYLNGNPMTSNQVWINAGTNVAFYATNDKAGYAFQGFTGNNGILNGVAYSGVSGVDSVAGSPVASNQQYTYSTPPPQSNYNNGQYQYDLIESKFGIPIDAGANYFDREACQYTPISVVMNSPVIENANYYLTKNVTGSSVNITVNYAYYNVTELISDSQSSGSEIFSITISKVSLINSGTQVVTVSNITPYSNYSYGIGNEIIYYLNQYSSSSFFNFNPYYYTYTASYYTSNFQSPHLSFMPTEYSYVVNQTISQMENKYPLTYNSVNNGRGLTTYSLRTLQLSFNLSGTKVYWHYNDVPSGTIYYDYYYDQQGIMQINEYSNFFGYSNYGWLWCP